MKISIAMATYNGEQYLQEQLDSFSAQSRWPDELVVCDDGSNDSTVEILKQFAVTAPFDVNIYTFESNIGHIKNFETAISRCSGGVIFLSDQDDVWCPEKIAVLERHLSRDNSKYLLQSDMMIADENMNDSGFSKLSNITALGMKPSAFNTGCGMAIRKELVEVAIPIPEDIWGHDIWFGMLAHALGVSSLVEDKLMYYRRHDANVSHWLASEARALSWRDSFKLHGLKPASKGWEEQRKRLRDIEKRIQEKRAIINEYFGANNADRALRLLRHQQVQISNRIMLASKPRLTRWPHVIGLLEKGGYQQFSGWKSAVKDILRP